MPINYKEQSSSAHPFGVLRRVAAAATLTAVISGCTLAPTYVRPDAPIPNVYPSMANVQTTNSADIPWREFFKDPGMQRVIGLALEHNRDLRVAMLNVEKTRAEYRIQAADILPTVAASAASTSTKMPADLSAAGQTISRQYSASLGFSAFELDLFGRIRSLTLAAIENFHSVENDAQRARLTLVAEVAGMYLQMVSDKQLRDLTNETYINRKSNYEMIKKRHERGVASMLEVNQARTLLEEARTSLARYDTQVGKDQNALALLMGTPIPTDLADVRNLSDVIKLPDVPEGLPSSLIERRPDILSAEHLLKSANANIGAARANFFPTISLTGSLGALTADYHDLFKGPQGTWSFAPSVSLPIFDTGRNIARLDVANTSRDIAVATYEKTIQSAFSEVADTLVQRNYIGEELDAQKELLKASKGSYDLSGQRYKIGIDNMLTYLDAQRSYFAAQQGYVGSLLLRETNALTLYKSLGGGWR